MKKESLTDPVESEWCADEVHQGQMDREEEWTENVHEGYEANLFNDAENDN